MSEPDDEQRAIDAGDAEMEREEYERQQSKRHHPTARGRTE